jgi:cytochrome P450
MKAPSPQLAESEIIDGLVKNPLSFFTGLTEKLGDHFTFKIGDLEINFINDPLSIEVVFEDGDNYKKKPDDTSEQGYLGMMSGICAMFTPELVNSYTSCMSAAAERSVDRIKSLEEGKDLDIFHEMMLLTLEIEIETLYSVNLEHLIGDHPDLDLSEVCRNLMLADRVYGFDPVYTGLSDHLPEFTRNAQSQEARNYLVNFLKKVIETFKKYPKEKTLMKYLTYNLPEEKLVDTALVILGAHHEVAVPAISRVWQLLSENPEVESKLSTELSTVLSGRAATQEDLKDLKYTHMVMHEVRRLYPCVWMVMRWSREERQINNFVIPKDSVVMMSQWVSHRDSSHFVDPLVFNPERWTDEAIQRLEGIPFFPFSKGIRSCAGEQFAEMQDALILATMAQSLRFNLESNQDLSPLARRSNAPQLGIRGTVTLKD